jgi:N-acetylmuramate 1-kinase
MPKKIETEGEQQNDIRLDDIKTWIATDLKLPDIKIEVASADASFRRYFRLFSGNDRWVIMDAPPEKEDCKPFVEIAGLLEVAGVQSPHVFNFNEQQGFMRLSDLGSTAYLDKLNISTADALYADAIHALVNMQTIQADLSKYDAELLQFEMSLFKDWYLHKHLNIELDEKQNKIIADTVSLLTESALQQSPVFVHRDYHSRNLMITANNNPGVIDFQDAVNGPPCYDLVSLIKDCYIAWPRKKQLEWIDQYLSLSPLKLNRQLFIKQLDFMGMQRHLKAIGIFARLNHRDNKSAYLNDIPRTLAYVVDVSQRYNELAEFSELLNRLKLKGDAQTLQLIQ